jgi:DNA-3-methyladenine glycosylase II
LSYNSKTMEEALRHFKKSDPVLYKLALQVKLSDLNRPEDLFVDLVDSIVSQQLSGKAAATIFGRLKKMFPNEKITPEKLLKIPDEKIREAGISYSKIKYIKGIAQKIVDKELDLEALDKLSDEEVIKELIKIKGIGAWTAEMFLMFTLLRSDIFSTGDLGLQNAIHKHYKLKEKPTKEVLLKISAKWSPHRSLASRILWRSLELK